MRAGPELTNAALTYRVAHVDSSSSLKLRQRLNLSRAAVARPGLTVTVWLLIAACGAFAAWRLPVALFPDVVFPVIVVTAQTPEYSPANVEREVTVPLEQRLLGIAGRGALTASSNPTLAVLTVPFDFGITMEVAEQRVRSALSTVSLPPHTELAIRRVNLNESPVVIYAITDPSISSRPAAAAVAPLIARLTHEPGVAQVTQMGFEHAAAGAAPTRVTLDGTPALGLEVIKHAGANTLQLAKSLDRDLSDERTRSALRIVPVRAEAPFIREATGATLDTLWIAVVLAIVVIHPFLRNFRATLISALAIPSSLFGTFLVMALAGFKFESITLLALALVIGIIIDDAIVDVENIVRHLRPSEPTHLAVVRATDEIGLTVSAATLTIAAVFVPVGLMGGVVGTFFRPFGLTISAAVLTSLAVARTLTPVLAARWLRADQHATPPAFWQHIANAYRPVLAWSLRHPAMVLTAAGISLIAGLALIPLIPQGFIPVLDRGECEVRFGLPLQSSPAAADQAAEQLVRLVASDRDVLHVMSVIGDGGDPSHGILHVTLKADRHSKTQVVESRLRTLLAHGSPLRVSVDHVPIIPVAAAQPLEITLISPHAEALPAAARRVLLTLRDWPGLADLSLAGAGDAGDGTARRYNGAPAAVIHGNLTGTVALGDISERVENEIPKLLPAGVHLALEGESAQASDVFGHFASALSYALVGVLLVLWLLFRSWQDPVAIAISLPLSVVGAMLGLWAARSDFGIVSLLGLVFLFGLVNKNAILLVDRINQLRATGYARDAAILESGPIRLRPILMTTAAAVLGMLPIALGFGAGAELRAPMAIAIIGGLLTSTLLSLVVVPVLYQLLDRLRPRYEERRS
jgi:multidrug efflux pump subunit AcrB